MEQHSVNKNSKKFEHLLENLLNEAAQMRGNGHNEHLVDKLNDKYDHVKEFVAEAAKRNMERLEQGKEKIKVAADVVDKSVHNNPWAYVGGAAAVSLLVGFILGHSRRG